MENSRLAGSARQVLAKRGLGSLSLAGPEALLLGLLCLSPACADIYTYTDSDGMVYLSNAPANKRYQVLIPETSDKTPAAEDRKPPSGLARKLQYDQLVDEVARTYGLDSALLHAVISVESQYNPNAVSKKGASGLMQLMPAIAKHYGVVNMFDPVQNLHGGAKYLRDMLILFNSDVSLAVAAYNAGETAVMRYGNRIPPFRETMKYVPKVLGYYQEYRADRSRQSGALTVNGAAPPLLSGRATASNFVNVRAFPARDNL